MCSADEGKLGTYRSHVNVMDQGFPRRRVTAVDRNGFAIVPKPDPATPEGAYDRPEIIP